MSNTIIADSVGGVPHVAAFDKVVAKRLGALPLDALLVYFIDNVPAPALPALAEQFDVLGYKGLALAKTEQDVRALIKNAISIKRHAGTPYAVITAINSVGFADATLQERLSGEHWTRFMVTIKIGDRGMSGSDLTAVTELINIYKSARSHLLGLTLHVDLDESVIANDDDLNVGQNELFEDNLYIGGGVFRNGSVTRNGTVNYSADSDIIEINILS